MKEKIYTKFGKQPTLRGFIKKLFSSKTCSEVRTCETYFNIECTEIQCKAFKYRSLEDLMIIVNTYYPGTEVKTLLRTMMTTTFKNQYGEELYLYPLSCRDIDRTTFCYAGTINVIKEICRNSDYVTRNSLYTPNECFNIFGFTPDELIRYIQKNKK